MRNRLGGKVSRRCANTPARDPEPKEFEMQTNVSETERLDRFVSALPGYAAWLAEQDRDYWLAQLRKAALKHYATLPDCPGCGGCETCQLAETLAYTGPKAERL